MRQANFTQGGGAVQEPGSTLDMPPYQQSNKGGDLRVNLSALGGRKSSDQRSQADENSASAGLSKGLSAAQHNAPHSALTRVDDVFSRAAD